MVETLVPPPPSVGGRRVGYPEARGGRPGRGRRTRTWVEVPRVFGPGPVVLSPEARPLSAPPRRHPHVITVSPRKKPRGARRTGGESRGRRSPVGH